MHTSRHGTLDARKPILVRVGIRTTGARLGLRLCLWVIFQVLAFGDLPESCAGISTIGVRVRTESISVAVEHGEFMKPSIT